MGGKIRYVIFFVLVLSVFLVSLCFASEIYYFVDEKGVYHFTDLPDDKRYRPFRLWESGLTKEEIEYAVREISNRYKVDPLLIMAIIKVESDFNPYAVSIKNAQGLMQLAPITQSELGVKDPFDPYANIEAGIRYIKFLLDKYKQLELSLAAYNAGPGAVDKYGGIPPYKETRNYIKRVLKYYKKLKGVKLAQ